MQVLRQGSTGNDVRLWQNYLLGRGLYRGSVDGNYGPATAEATRGFQYSLFLDTDGIVGPRTFAAALNHNFAYMEENGTDETGANWPPAPSFGSPDASVMLGKFRYKVLSGGDIQILDGWEEKNIVRVPLPELSHLVPRGVLFHTRAAAQLQALVKAWSVKGLLDRIHTWDGSFVPRMIRGSTTRLSNHAYGTAFDINCDDNALGHVPALLGKPGCIRELVPLANEHGFYWGGHYRTRPDGMHFEVAMLPGK